MLWLTLEIVRMAYRCRRLWRRIENGWVAGSNLTIGLIGEGETGWVPAVKVVVEDTMACAFGKICGWSASPAVKCVRRSR